ncbi:flagellar assembly protein FliX [Caulobacter sp. 17J80-11]|uniref:flagellar assembly protein FliX n=1 Tax=Caulobacter sp. 17J80-11 TaxID=2763502 RepID=UPI00165394C2|nr:flagellar assembly protein FliX [Caulobacter sp. 17J80-11]MBC6981778.1 flagellar assembly protein FliX [Caulobacter sp. 17J80-11]
MKINGTGGPSSVGASRPSRASAGGGFSVGSAGESRESAPAAKAGAVGGVSSVDALLALQATEGPLERRRRAMGRASRILDRLDEIKLSMLGGGAAAGVALQDLAQAVREERAETDDTGLEGVLNEIETRAAVELAKAEMGRVAA